jgi:hypothetical protein
LPKKKKKSEVKEYTTKAGDQVQYSVAESGFNPRHCKPREIVIRMDNSTLYRTNSPVKSYIAVSGARKKH